MYAAEPRAGLVVDCRLIGSRLQYNNKTSDLRHWELFGKIVGPDCGVINATEIQNSEIIVARYEYQTKTMRLFGK